MSDTDKIKDLERELKTAFKEGRFEDVRKLAGNLKSEDSENHLADRILEKTGAAEAEKLRKMNSEKISGLEKQIKEAFKNGLIAEVNKLAEEIKKLDPGNKTINKIETQIAKAKAAIMADAKKEKIKALESRIKESMKSEQWDNVAETANKLLSEEWNHSSAVKALKKAAKAKNVEYAALVTSAPPEEEAGIGTKLMKDTKSELVAEIKKDEVKKAAKAKNTEDTSLITVSRNEGIVKQGFFSRLFGKKADVQTEGLKPDAENVKETGVKAVVAGPVMQAAREEQSPAITPAEFFAPKPEMIRPGAPTPPVKPTVAESKPVVKAGIFSPFRSVFTAAPEPSSAPAAMAKPVAEVPAGKPAGIKAEKAKPTVAVGAISPSEEAQEKGNIFTRLFGKKQAEKPESIIETIVAQSGRPKTEETRKPISMFKKAEDAGEGYLKFANLFLRFSVVFIVLSGIFFYIYNIDIENRVLGAFNKENYAIRLKNAADDLEEKKTEEEKVNNEIDKYSAGYQNEYQSNIDKIISNRMNWSSLIRKLNEVTESVYEKNALSKYVTYNNYSYDVTAGQLRVNGELRDPLGKNLTKLAELEEAFKYYPKDKDDPADERKPYFYNMQEFTSYSKSLDSATGRFTSNFSLSLYTKEPTQ